MKYAFEMGSGAMMYRPSFIKIGSGIQKLIRGDSQTQDGDRIGLLFVPLSRILKVLVLNIYRDTGYSVRFFMDVNLHGNSVLNISKGTTSSSLSVPFRRH
jgi:hypothetical protein